MVEKNLRYDNFDLFDVTNEATPPHKEGHLKAHIKGSQINENFKSCSQSETDQILVDNVKSLACFVSNQMGNRKDLFLRDEMFLKSINLMDLVSSNSTRTSCFTKKFVIKIY